MRPAIPVVETTPLGVPSPKAPVARSSLARAEREPGPFVRELRAEDLPRSAAADEADGEPDGAADEPPLAA